jgi:aspartyl protease
MTRVHFDPPAPVARVALRNPHSGATVSDVPVLLDTGADVTLLPRTAVERLGVPLPPDQRHELMSFDGSKSFAPVVMLDLLCDLAIGWSTIAMVGALGVGRGDGTAPDHTLERMRWTARRSALGIRWLISGEQLADDELENGNRHKVCHPVARGWVASGHRRSR